MAEGTIIKALSGFYYVHSDEGYYQCRGRGVFRKRKVKPLVGDQVTFEADNQTDGYIMDVHKRKNEMVRPPVANIDQVILVFSIVEPNFSSLLLDRFLVHVENHSIEPAIVISKWDLASSQQRERIQSIRNIYEELGYPVHFISTVSKEGMNEIENIFNEKTTVIAGQSGVGKSSLLNALKPNLNLETDEISTHLGRGKHTTRHVELIELLGGWVADTPGFSALDFTDMDAQELGLMFPEIRASLPNCKFRGCSHRKEPGCAVKEAVEKEDMAAFRYDHYLQFYDEILKQRRY